MITRSWPGPLLRLLTANDAGPSAPWPETISTLATIGSGNITPRNETPLGLAGALNEPRLRPAASNRLSLLDPARSMSENTTPNPVVVAGVLEPGTKNCTP